MNDLGKLTATNLTAAAEECLRAHGYDAVAVGEEMAGAGRFYEDDYGIVLVSIFDTWGELSERWAESQAALVRLISAHLTKSEAKAWDGYLVLLTPASAPDGRERIEEIRHDTSRVRKLVADGEELQSIGAVEEVLLPLLPLRVAAEVGDGSSVLELLPGLLVERGVDRRVAGALIAAFEAGEPLIEALHGLEDL
jgi:hypothetical protein